jgi:hypothetical protein
MPYMRVLTKATQPFLCYLPEVLESNNNGRVMHVSTMATQLFLRYFPQESHRQQQRQSYSRLH